ncbi:hypothetical protein B5X24_HaOG213166 [Helicoverpa armigera]|uniref:Uncharacterized protein n=1 Tax=Helicoverpa armigera TaxID=29058 RepID=A0A2W1B5S8_HELAM|nr:hypothetical protein B5X24_HaOG213166 [Helicoverpa armigera]
MSILTQGRFASSTGNSKICSEQIMADKRQKQSGTKSASIADGSWIRLSGKRCLTIYGSTALVASGLQNPGPSRHQAQTQNGVTPHVQTQKSFSIAMTTHSLECSTTEQNPSCHKPFPVKLD